MNRLLFLTLFSILGSSLANRFDYVVAGAGTSGCVVARRLIDAGFKVALVERGKIITSPEIIFQKTSPRQTFSTWEYQELTKRFQSIPNDLGISEEILVGNGFGGTTSINAGLYSRSASSHYDSWGVPLWSGEDVKPYFQKIERFRDSSGPDRGSSGTIPIRKMFSHTYVNESLKVFESAGFTVVEQGFENNSPNVVSENLVISDENYHRVDSFSAYLASNLSSPLLTIFEDTVVEKVLFTGTIPNQVATGVQFIRSGTETRRIYVNKEVILCTGVFETPKILHLSGIGPNQILGPIGIPTRVPLPVGFNLVARPLAGLIYSGVSLTEEQNASYAFDPQTQAEFISGKHNYFSHTINSILGFGSIDGFSTDYMVQYTGTLPLFSYAATGHVFGCLLGDPKSRGFAIARSSNPFDSPLVDLNFYDDLEDLNAMIHCIERIRTGVQGYAMSALYLGQELSPGVTGEDLASFLLYNSDYSYHAFGTCRLGTNPAESVVGPTLKVHTFENLRIADASVIPNIGTGLMGATYMIGERASDFLLQESYTISYDFTLGFNSCKEKGFIVVSDPNLSTTGDDIELVCQSLGAIALKVSDYVNLTCDTKRAQEALLSCGFTEGFISDNNGICRSLDQNGVNQSVQCSSNLPLLCRDTTDVLF